MVLPSYETDRVAINPFGKANFGTLANILTYVQYKQFFWLLIGKMATAVSSSNDFVACKFC